MTTLQGDEEALYRRLMRDIIPKSAADALVALHVAVGLQLCLTSLAWHSVRADGRSLVSLLISLLILAGAAFLLFF